MAANPALTQQASHSRDDPVVTGLVTRATDGDRQAWDALIDRYAPLVWSICRRHRLEAADAQDAAQTVWLSSWTTWTRSATRPRCPAGWPPPPSTNAAASSAPSGDPATPGMRCAETIADDHAQTAEQDLLAAERHAALREAPGSCPPAASSCSPCSSRTRPCPMPRSAPGWASRSAASGPPAAAAWTSYAATRPSPR